MQRAIPTAAAPIAVAYDEALPMTSAANGHALKLRAASDAIPRGKGDPPSWAELVARADKVNLTVTGPIAPPGGTRCAGLETAGGRRLFSTQAMLVEGVEDNRDRMLRSALAAAIWATPRQIEPATTETPTDG
jgi:hypothetical protein